MSLTFVIVLSLCVTLTYSKNQYVQPLNMGMQMAIPYDIANLFIRPIAGVTSVVLSIGLALIILFGIITSPFGYFFGIPSRQYVMGGEPAKEPTLSRSLGQVPDFGQSAFWMFHPDFSDRSCQLLISCYAHGALRHLPPRVTKAYTFFSKNLVNIDEDFKTAILEGVEDNSLCSELYDSCDASIFSIIIKSLVNLLPTRFRQRTKTSANYQ